MLGRYTKYLNIGLGGTVGTVAGDLVGRVLSSPLVGYCYENIMTADFCYQNLTLVKDSIFNPTSSTSVASCVSELNPVYVCLVAGMGIAGATCGYVYSRPHRVRFHDVVVEVIRELDGDDVEDQSDDEEDQVQAIVREDNEHERRLAAAGYTGDIPRKYQDAVYQNIMVDPVILLTVDHTTTSDSIDETTVIDIMSRSNDPICPLTRKPFDGYILNRSLKNEIKEWVDAKVRELTEKSLNEMPREKCREKLIELQRFFAHRKPLPARSEEEMRRFIRCSQ